MKPIFHKRKYEFPDGLSLELGHRTLIMGILNITPDSFSDGGSYMDVDAAVERARRMEEEGADLIDIGGESTRPGHEPVSAEEEIRRIVPVIQAVREQVKLPISVDTYKPETARAALEAGAHILNDIWGFKQDPQMAAVAADYGCPVILMHNRRVRDYLDFVPDVLADLQGSLDRAKAAGVAPENIWLDPGIGFAKDYDENLELMGHLDKIVALGYPVLLATSRKLFIRTVLGLPAGDVVEGTNATTSIGILQGCQMVRVHDVKQAVRTARMTDAIVYRQAAKGDE
ncbi:dihydropteroate synthase [Cohnella thailandensis]|uniref:Dihydropteroate synthase n=1 Tax=Cohnella thailandensis TaxID=557557 RepID=A0A841T772_9BACL|nr:dihydropteroate synthase [Cohnella thailandensis]MBB6637920.1 dihydropteroate synthase [Cohnella thailandensis]MBP1977742.1 dihydropteroate synthase [Cohnella thailandensis]